jgi:hypothetical protein
METPLRGGYNRRLRADSDESIEPPRHSLLGDTAVIDGEAPELKIRVRALVEEYMYTFTGLGVSRDDIELIIDKDYNYALNEQGLAYDRLEMKVDRKVEDKTVRYLATLGLSRVDQVPGLDESIRQYRRRKLSKGLTSIVTETWNRLNDRFHRLFDPLLGPRLQDVIAEARASLQIAYTRIRELEDEAFMARENLDNQIDTLLDKCETLETLLRIATIVLVRRGYIDR